jgi:carboxymethylenebutenolidase
MPEITIPSADGSFTAYLSSPGKTPAPALLLLVEVYGINRFMRRIADYWAGQGYLAVVPDLYWRTKPKLGLDPETPGHKEQALEASAAIDTDKAVVDVQAAATYLRSLSECNGKVATSGYCMGGKLAYLAGARTDLDANVSYYGVGIENYLGEAPALKSPLLLHFGGADPYTSPAVQAATGAALCLNSLAQLHIWGGIGHAFARDGMAAAEVTAIKEQANAITAEFLRRALG